MRAGDTSAQTMAEETYRNGHLFFFSSRRRHTRYIGDWSSDVCSSDLRVALRVVAGLLGALEDLHEPAVGVLAAARRDALRDDGRAGVLAHVDHLGARVGLLPVVGHRRSEEHTSELQSPMYLVCRLLLE